MVVEMLRGLQARFPWLASWSGGRLDLELPALSVSLLVHGVLLTGLALPSMWTFYESTSRGPVTLPDILHVPYGTVVFAVVVIAIAAFQVADRVEKRA